MKKIYLSISAIALCAFAQGQSFVQQATGITPKQAYQPKSTNFSVAKTQKVTGGVVAGRFDPSYSLPIARGKTVGSTGAEDYGVYVAPIFVDSTVQSSFSTASVIDGHFIGQNFDPKSIIFDPNFVSLFSKTDSYTLDTVWIGGVYQRRGHSIDDTLIVEIVWGDTSNTAVFSRWSYASAPISGFGPFVTPKFTTVAGTPGDQIRYAAPASNKISIKHVLTKADSTYMADVSDYLPIAINGTLGQLIPANNIVNCGFSFNAGGTHSMGDISWASSTSPNPGVISGWAAIQYAQDVPAIAAISDVSDGYDDFGTGKNFSIDIFKKGRYGQEAGAFATAARGAFYWGYWIDFSVHGTSTVGMQELEKNGFLLGQNIPNPFSGSSKVNYMIEKEATSAIFTVTDVMGRVISSQKADASKGTHSIDLGTYAAGVYYYSLNIDGKVTTMKMIAQ